MSSLFQTNNLISSEDDAAMALQVSKALTSALLKYRLKSVPSDKVSCFLMPVSAWPCLFSCIQSQFFECLGCVTFAVQRCPRLYDLMTIFNDSVHSSTVWWPQVDFIIQCCSYDEFHLYILSWGDCTWLKGHSTPRTECLVGCQTIIVCNTTDWSDEGLHWEELLVLSYKLAQ